MGVAAMDLTRTAQREVINSPRIPIVPRFSQAIRVGNTLYVSGTRGIDPRTGKVIAGGIVEQTRRALQNLKWILEAGRMTIGDVAKCTVFITNKNDFDAVNAEYIKVFSKAPPARTVVQVSWLNEDSLVEIEAIAVDTKMTCRFTPIQSRL
ncbi:2-iminobutanoate/2-iminopropanoate deaminase-like [Dermacentor silvarum]|uniref:2-iminobutanoate/2-iminopropanoate deaminase-like n=1 Tax=Dermacentor silvarum TaxID=543639 RepID=UPI0018994EC3|nr:2-iminobutanoate/2-iminopropanoate deaminase-like [Dermacentor silvarum]